MTTSPISAVPISIETELGMIQLELYPERMPITCENFLRYLDAASFDAASFYRVVRADNQAVDNIKIDVIQGGLGMGEHPLKYPPIAHETTEQSGLKHEDGTISMGRFAPGSANAEFFICVGVQPELDFGGRRNPDGQGFAAFGRVTSGMDVVRQIHQSPAEGQQLKPAIAIHSIRRG